MTQNDWLNLKVGSLVSKGTPEDRAFGVVTHIQVSPLTHAIDWMFVRWTKWEKYVNCEIQNNYWDLVNPHTTVVQHPGE